MMMSEFIERTGYEPNYEEYRYIEESYYKFNGNKDEFCKQWKKDHKDGHWMTELCLMVERDNMKAEYEKKIEEQEDSLKFYRKQFENYRKMVKDYEEALNKLERINRILNSEGVKEIVA